jgi:hypothetical protein
LLFSSMININSRGSISASMIIPEFGPFSAICPLLFPKFNPYFPFSHQNPPACWRV